MQNNICPQCKTENEPEYKYCKNCGAPIFAAATEQGASQGTGENQAAENAGGVFIDGNPIDKVYTFVGKNAHKIVPKFIKINESGSKTEWCWPPFILGFFLGPAGVAIWLLYRKMYKPACLLGGISVVLGYITAAIEFFFNIGNVTTERLEQFFDSFALTGRFDLGGFLSTLTDRDMIMANMLNSFKNAINLASAILFGIFGIYLYKRHTARKIASYKPVSNDPNYIKIGLASSGGTSPGAAILGVVIISVLSNVPNVIIDALKWAGVM